MHQTGWTALVVDLLLDPPGAPGRPSHTTPPGSAAGEQHLD
jgi:hypothetical protein